MRMVRLSTGDAQRLWNLLHKMSWSGLRSVMEDHTARRLIESGGLDEQTMDLILSEAARMEQQGEPFTSTSEELRQKLNQRIEEREVA